jgi:hypothetical protein
MSVCSCSLELMALGEMAVPEQKLKIVRVVRHVEESASEPDTSFDFTSSTANNSPSLMSKVCVNTLSKIQYSNLQTCLQKAVHIDR